MIEIRTGDLLQSEAEALVNTVNCVGVMGKGIALAFKQQFPDNFRRYADACKAGNVKPGSMLVCRGPGNNDNAQTSDMFAAEDAGGKGPKWIVNFPTKLDWRNPSKMVWIDDGLKGLVAFLKAHDVKSVAIPALGCSNGGLSWDDVRPRIEAAMALVPDVRVLLFPPQGL